MPFKITAKTTDESLQREFLAQPGLTLLEYLQNAEVPIKSSCLGKGLCRQCRVKVVSGFALVTNQDRKSFSEEQLKDGWRLSCGIRPKVNCEVFYPQSYSFKESFHFLREPISDFQLICDYGTTGVEIGAIDENGIFASVTELNKQVLHGADIMTRLEFAQRNGVSELLEIGQKQIKKLSTLILEKIAEKTKYSLKNKTMRIAGNSAVISFITNLDIEKLAVSPYQPVTFETQKRDWTEWEIETLPLMSSFIGGDLFAGLYYLWKTQRQTFEKSFLLMDVGTNSEILLWDKEKLWISSTPAGPAFEGSNISIGMRAENGAITEPTYDSALKKWNYKVIGGDLPKGICGSALIQFMSEAVKAGIIQPDGEVLSSEQLQFSSKLQLTQDDVREFQLAKSAIRTGLELLLETSKSDCSKLFLAGTFGEHIPLLSAKNIGLLPPELEVETLGNSSLKGTDVWVRSNPSEQQDFRKWLDEKKYPFELSLSDQFQELFVKNMTL